MLCGVLLEESKSVLILILCVIASMVATTSQRPSTEFQSDRAQGIIDYNRRALHSRMQEKTISHASKVEEASSEYYSRHAIGLKKLLWLLLDLYIDKDKSTFLESSKAPLSDEDTNAPSRQKRSFGFEIVSDATMPKGVSTDMKTFFARRKTTKKLYHRSSSSLIQILPDGTISGTPVFNKYCVLTLKSVGHVNDKTLVKIFGESARRYLAMTSKGVLYTTEDANIKETDFLHEYAPRTHDAYISQEYGRYVTFSGGNGLSVPRRAKRVVSGRATPKGSHFLLLNASQNELLEAKKEETSMKPSSVAVTRSKKERRKGRTKKKKSNSRSSRKKKKKRRRGKTKKVNDRRKRKFGRKHKPPSKSKRVRSRGKLRTTATDPDKVT